MATYDIARDLDFQDLDLTMRKNRRSRDLAALTGIDAIVTSVENLVHLNFYEKPFHPNIGSNVRKLLFENINHLTSTFILNAITEVIINFEPRVKLIDVVVTPAPEDNRYAVAIVFSINGVSDPIRINTFLTRVR